MRDLTGDYSGKNERILPFEITLNRPYGTRENPITEAELYDIRVRGEMGELKAQGYDGIIYRNIAEDEGSISYLVLDEGNIRQLRGSWTPDQPGPEGGITTLMPRDPFEVLSHLRDPRSGRAMAERRDEKGLTYAEWEKQGTRLFQQVRKYGDPDTIADLVAGDVEDGIDFLWSLRSGNRPDYWERSSKPPTAADVRSIRKQMYKVTQDMLADFDDTITVYRYGKVSPDSLHFFSLNPRYSGPTIWHKERYPRISYAVDKKDIIVATDAVLGTSMPDLPDLSGESEWEVIILGEDVRYLDQEPVAEASTAFPFSASSWTGDRKGRPPGDEPGPEGKASGGFVDKPLYESARLIG
jgi:hypothetical protein